MLSRKAYLEQNKWTDLFNSLYDEKNFLFFFRVSISLIALIEIGSLAVDFHYFFGTSGTIIPQELMYLQTSDFKYLHSLYQFLRAEGLTEYFYSGAVYIYVISLIFLLFGLFTRYTAIVVLIFQLIIYRSFSHFNYGYDNFLTMSLFYCVVFPVGKYYSIDSKLFSRATEIRFNYQRVIQIHLMIAYFFSGIAKALDSGWWNGNSVWRALASLDNSYYSIPSILLIIVGIGTVLLEFLYPFLMYFRISRKYALLGILLMHTCIAVMMGLYAFSAIMIVWNIAAFGDVFKKEDEHEVQPA